MANPVPPVIPVARINGAVALARAWQAFKLYDGAHQAVRHRIREFCTATKAHGAAACYQTERGRMTVDGKALEPIELFAPFSAALQRAGLLGLEIRGAIEPAQAQALLALLGEAKVDDLQALGSLPKRISKATSGRIRAHRLSVETLRLRAILPGKAPQESRDLRLHDMNQGTADSIEPGERRGQSRRPTDPIQRVVDASVRVAHAAASGTRAEDDLAAIHEVIDRLNTSDRRQLLQALAADDRVPFESAMQVLSLMPVKDVADAIRVLERGDSRLSEPALMLMRRLATLSVGSDVDLDRLTRVAEKWAADESEEQEKRSIASTTASLLQKVAECPPQSEEYSTLLEGLSSAGTGESRVMRALVADDLARVQTRVIETMCEVISSGRTPDHDLSDSLHFLEERMGAIADRGCVDLVVRVMKLARSTPQDARNDREQRAARSLLETAATQRWLARALAGLHDAGRTRTVIERMRMDAHEAAPLFVAAVSMASTEANRSALLACRDLFETVDVKRAITIHVSDEPRSGAALVDLVEAVCPAEALDILKPTLLSGDDEIRRATFVAMGRTPTQWPKDLCVRGMMDVDEGVRVATIQAMSRWAHVAAPLLIDRLAGQFGDPAMLPDEQRAVEQAMNGDARTSVTRRMAVVLVLKSLLPVNVVDCSHLAQALRARRRTLLAGIALVVWKVSPTQWFKRRANRRNEAY